ncbi:hypothetical protein GCM10010276_31850 [Streptomyces longisporus]|uniref:Ricin B lectin domain-containing protein n=1 Tax=Streptomyces longisporus TaxID=1948 RepID=A0ABN3LU66_STRLO
MIGGYVTSTNVNSGKCLEVAGSSTANGAALDQSTCNTNQQWMVVRRSSSGLRGDRRLLRGVAVAGPCVPVEGEATDKGG